MKSNQDQINRLQKYVEKTKRQFDMETRQSMREFLQRELTKTARKLEELKLT